MKQSIPTLDTGRRDHKFVRLIGRHPDRLMNDVIWHRGIYPCEISPDIKAGREIGR